MNNTFRGQMELISVIVPVYNAEKYLLRSMDSIMAQSFKDIEIICIDDASTDNSVSVLQELQQCDNRIKIIQHDVNKGAAVSRNDGLKLARGEYVIFLDSDDYFYENMLKEAYEKAVMHDADVVIFSSEQVRVIEDGDFKDFPVTNSVQYEYQVIDNVDKKINFICKARHVPWDKLVKRKFLNDNRIKFQNLPANEDVLYSYATVLLAEKIVTCNKVFVRYFCGREGSLTAFCSNKENYMIEAYHAVWQFMQENEIDEKLKITLLNGLLDNLQRYFSNPDNLLQIREKTLHKFKSDSTFLTSLKEYADNNRFYPHNNVFVQRFCKGDNICELPYEQYLLERLKNVILPLRQQRKKIAVWGCGERGKQLLDLLKRYKLKIDYVIDEAEKQQGKMYGSYYISAYEPLKEKVDVILITNMQFFDEIQKRAEGKQIIYVWQ